MKARLDSLLVDRGLVESRERAQALILAGKVRVNGAPAGKAGRPIDTEACLEVAEELPYVSRGGFKLEAALEAFPVEVAGRLCLDVGASTGGFTDCLLQRGAARVAAVDVGRGQLHWKLRSDPRVTVIEKQNARYLRPGDLPFVPSLTVIDVSFISLTLILPPAIEVMTAGGDLITLIKPQFEAGRDQVESGGVVRDPAVREAVVERVRRFGQGSGLTWGGVTTSPVKGPAGNVEFLAWWRAPTSGGQATCT